MRESRQVTVSKFGLEVYCPGANLHLRINQHGEVTILGKQTLRAKFSKGIYAESLSVDFQYADVWAHPKNIDSPQAPYIHMQDATHIEIARYHSDKEAQEFRTAYASGSEALTEFHAKNHPGPKNIVEGLARYGNQY